jgi:hypothetical protein
MRVFKNLVGWPTFYYLAQVHENHIIGEPFRLPQDVGDQDNGVPLLQRQKPFLDVLSGYGIQRRGRFISQNDFGFDS